MPIEYTPPTFVAGLDHKTDAGGSTAMQASVMQAIVNTLKQATDAVDALEGGGGTAVTLGPTPPSNGFWVDMDLPVVSATAPTFTDPSGTGGDTYTIPSVANVIYKISGSVVAAGTYAGSGSVTVTAEAAPGYSLAGTDTWSYTFSTGADPVPVTPSAPSFDDTADTYTIPSTTGVDYKVSGSTVAAGVYSVGNVATTVTVTAVAQSGYTLTGTTSWNGSFTVSASMWTPAGSTVLTSDSFTGAAANAESRATDVTWGGTPVTPTATVAGVVVTDGDSARATAVGRLRYAVGGTARVYIGVKIAAIPLSTQAFDVRYALPTSGGSVPAIKLQSATGNRATFYQDGTSTGTHVIVAAGDQVGMAIDGTTVTYYHNGVSIVTGTTAASGTTHGFVGFGAASATLISDIVFAQLA